MLFPTNIVVINLEGLELKTVKIRELNLDSFEASSNLSLFEATKAISKPEKNADKTTIIAIINQSILFPIFSSFHIFSL